jgi:hypothetical protein
MKGTYFFILLESADPLGKGDVFILVEPATPLGKGRCHYFG